jgi:hypothetical protein
MRRVIRASAMALVSIAIPAIALLAPTAASAAAILPYSTGFESPTFVPGSINGQDGWTVYGSTSDVTTAAAHTGSQSLFVTPVAGDGNVIKSSTPLFDPSGETPSMYVPTPASSFMQTDFWFRSVFNTSDTGLYISTSMGNPASVRNTWFGIFEGGELGGTAGALQVGAYAIDSLGNFVPYLSPQLVWGNWYHATISEQYVNGPDNDLVTYSLQDSANLSLWSVTVGSWENYYLTCGTCEQAPGPVVSNRTSFGGDVVDGGHGIYVDDFSMTNVARAAAVPEPFTLSIFGAGLVGAAAMRRRKKAKQA